MWTEHLLKAALIAAVLFLVGLASAYFRKRPNRSKKRAGAVRMPKLIAVVGWAFVAVGAMMGIAAFTTGDADGPQETTEMRIASIAIVVGGVCFVLIYRNFWIKPGPYEVQFRTVLGRERHIRYDQIVAYSRFTSHGQPYLRIKAADGTQLSLNSRTYDVTPIEDAIKSYEVHGVWPTPGTAHLHGQGPPTIPGVS